MKITCEFASGYYLMIQVRGDEAFFFNSIIMFLVDDLRDSDTVPEAIDCVNNLLELFNLASYS